MAEDQERQLDEAIAAYLKATPANQELSRQRLLDRYPHLALDLIDFFADYDHFEAVIAPLRKMDSEKKSI
jgi:hypothetical protein